ncbi:MAG: MobF family relaxase [Pirellulales bacterium]|nr:MobF family relaxase [Pirellulales bacterium]
MLTLTVLESGIEEYFNGIVNPDYYTGGGEPPGRWYGRGAERLGLLGRVEAEAFSRILEGLAPDGKPLQVTRRSKTEKYTNNISLANSAQRVPGYDLCFSAPKSVSALWGFGTRYIRTAIEEAFEVACTQTLDWFTANIPLSRRERGGRQEQFAELVIAKFGHATSRLIDGDDWQPQFHCHHVIANVARGTDGRWSAVNSRRLHEWARTLGPMFRAVLATELIERLGVSLYRPLDEQGRCASWFEIADVPSELCERWSGRRHEIEERIAAEGNGLGNASDAAARERANLATRKTKSSIPARSELFLKWEAMAREFGVTPQMLETITNRQQPQSNREQVFADCWHEALATIETTQATFTERDIIRTVCEAGQAMAVSGVWLADQTRKKLDADREIRCLGSLSGEKQYVTDEMWGREEQLLGNFETLRSVPGAKIQSYANFQSPSKQRLSDEQQTAVTDILQSKRALRLLTGVAGAGKSTTLNALREAFEAAGYRVHGAALSGTATEELTKKAGIPSRTIASHLHRLEGGANGFDKPNLQTSHNAGNTAVPTPPSEIQYGDILIIDEAGMVDAGTMLRLTEAAQRLSLTLILVGDVRQLQPIAPGGPFAHLMQTDQAAMLATNLRQQDPADRQAAQDFRHGDAASALRNYAERGRLTVAEDRAGALSALIAEWKANGGMSRPQDHVIFTGTRAESRAANRLAQRERAKAGIIDFASSIPHDGERFCLHDRVLFHKNVFADGIRNGYRGEVIAIDRFLKRITVRFDGDSGRQVTIRLADYGNQSLTHALSMTTHKSQGQTVDNAYLLVGGSMADRELAYVQATRGRCTTRLFVDRAHAGEELEALASTLSRSRVKELAHDVAARISQRENNTYERGL